MSQEKVDLEPKWYVIHTYSGYENKVKADLEQKVKNQEMEEYFFDIVVPMEEQIEIKDGFVGSGTDPIPLTDDEIRKMGFEISEINVDYDVNDSIEIIDGPFKDYVGVVQEINKEKHKVKVLISMFGRETPVDLELSQVQKVK